MASAYHSKPVSNEIAEGASFVCKVCAFDLWLPIARLSTSWLGLYDDARFPGRSLVVLDEHVEHLTDLDHDLACAFLEDVRRSAQAIQRATNAQRINYAFLGNVEPHLHCHLFPRVAGGDPIPTRPPWEHPLRRTPLDSRAVERLRSTIRSALVPPPGL